MLRVLRFGSRFSLGQLIEVSTCRELPWLKPSLQVSYGLTAGLCAPTHAVVQPPSWAKGFRRNAGATDRSVRGAAVILSGGARTATKHRRGARTRFRTSPAGRHHHAGNGSRA